MLSLFQTKVLVQPSQPFAGNETCVCVCIKACDPKNVETESGVDSQLRDGSGEALKELDFDSMGVRGGHRLKTLEPRQTAC